MQRFPSTFTDLAFLSAAEQISRDYIEFIKNVVMPEMSEHCDLNFRELRVASFLDFSGENISASEVADYMRQDRATIARSMVILVGGGYVTTSENFEDARSRLLHLTEKGQETAKLYRGILSSAISRIELDNGKLSLDLMGDAMLRNVMEIAERADFLHQASIKEKKKRKRQKKV